MEKISDIWAKSLELGNLIDKMKSYDIGEDILAKWESENNRLLNKLEEDEKTALEVSELKVDPNWDLPPKGKENNLFDRKNSQK